MHLPLRDSSVDVVLLMDVLEHVQYEPPILREARRVLKEGFLLFISAPNRFYPFETHGMHLFNVTFDNFLGVGIPLLSYMPKRLRCLIAIARIYTQKELFNLLESEKFDALIMEYDMPPLDALWF